MAKMINISGNPSVPIKSGCSDMTFSFGRETNGRSHGYYTTWGVGSQRDPETAIMMAMPLADKVIAGKTVFANEQAIRIREGDPSTALIPLA